MIIGREKELELLKSATRDEYSHFIAVYGRRRIGKTFLINEAFNYRFTFSHSAMSDGSYSMQLESFASSLNDYGLKVNKKPKNWLEAFDMLRELIKKSSEKKKVVFVDELSWMDTPRSDMLSALENFWNSFCVVRRDVVLIVCASATSWMMSNIIHNKGGLYNRLTEQINLTPFSLKECEDYAKSRNLICGREQIIQYYMIFGGIPFYWSFIKKGMSVYQNIDQLFFSFNAPLKKEFDYLFSSLFKKPEAYIKIVEALSTRKIGMNRNDIIDATGITNSGDLTKKLEDLEYCGFIRKYCSFGSKTKNAIYQLMDPFTYFYYSFMKDEPDDEHFWTNQLNMPKLNTWQGLAFERVCLLHINQIKIKLGISGVLTNVHSFSCKKDADNGIYGSQIDLLIARKDQIINLCEMKYSSGIYSIDKDTYLDIQKKISDLQKITGTRYAIHPILITTYGLLDNSYSSYMQAVVTMDDLFN